MSIRSQIVPCWVRNLTLLGLALYPIEPVFPDEVHPNEAGKAIFEKLCVECHGANGEGVEGKADDPLYGTRSLDSLAGRIERTMPEDNEDACVGEDAQAVAEYIYHAFYSLEARQKQAASRSSLAHLTTEQYKNSVADLVGHFRPNFHFDPGEDRGLKAYYFDSRNHRIDKKKNGADHFEQRDSRVAFDFAKGAPKTPAEKVLSAETFSIRWTGSLLARDTGWYEIRLRTRNGAMLHLNKLDTDSTATIDAWVAPDNKIREEKTRIYLLGGRAYPLTLEFFKYKEEAAEIELLWKPPHGALEVIPERALSPNQQRETLVISTRFPADDQSYGYARGVGLSREWLDAIKSGALETADYIALHLDDLADTKKGAPDRMTKLRQFSEKITELAFRRNLSKEERDFFINQRFEDAADPETALRRLLLLVLTSPRFLYPTLAFEQGTDDPWKRAANLSLALWDSVPSRKVIQRLEKGTLGNPKQWENLVWEMLYDPRARDKIRRFFHHWLELERASDIAKDEKAFPQFNETLLGDLRTSLHLFLEEVMWSDRPSYQRLLQSDFLFLNQRLSQVYAPDSPAPEAERFVKVSLPKQNRAGVITHPFLLSAFAYHDNTSPIHRGVFLTRNIAGIPLKPPPDATIFEDSKFDPTMTMREKVTELTRAKACMACHSTINPMGFSLEHFDAIGRYRSRERNNKPIDDDGTLPIDGGRQIKLSGPVDVANFAANDRDAHRSFLRQLFQFFFKNDPEMYHPNPLPKLEEEFAKSGYDIRSTLVAMMLAGTEAELGSQTVAKVPGARTAH